MSKPSAYPMWQSYTSKAAKPSVRQLTDTDAFEYDAKGFARRDSMCPLFVMKPSGRLDLESGEEQRLTPEADPENAIRYGVAEFVAQEEMSRYTGYWWSPDDRYLAYTRVDESTVDIIPRFDIAADEVTVIKQRYPRAGRPNAIVDLFVRDMETGEAIEVRLATRGLGPSDGSIFGAGELGGAFRAQTHCSENGPGPENSGVHDAHHTRHLVPPDAVPGLTCF